MLNLADKIKEIREGIGLSQTEFAKKIGYTQAAVARWEAGNRLPTINAIHAITKEFSIDINFFFSETE